VDTNQLELALLNLCLNARDAMHEGGDIILGAGEERIDAGDSTGLRPGQYIRLSVADTGEGMDAHTLRRAAEPFFTTKGVGKGTGLGLAMVHGFSEQSRGRLILHSQKGKGTTAELWLPIADRSMQGASLAPEPASPKPVRPLTILAVDDDTLVLMNMVAMLEDLGHTVFEAHSGKEALEILRREESIDLVITDQAMPKISGTELARAMKSEFPDIPVMLATGYTDKLGEEGIALPKLSKPYFQRDLSDAIVKMNPPRRKGDRVVKLRNRLVN
jgi:CheY-like chemotaxis protein